MESYDASKPIYLEKDASGIGLRASLFQMQEDMSWGHNEVPDNVVPCPIMFGSKSLSSMEWQYSDITRETLDILHGLKKFHHYCFASEIHVITDHEPLIAMVSKDVVTMSQ